MPKEIILSRGFIPEDETREPLVELSWQRNLEYVSLVTYARDRESRETIGRDEAQFVPLDRTAINHLIRKLRQARDQSFGKDE